MTGVQTCALPICFPVTICLVSVLRWYFKNDSAFYNEIEKILTLQNIDFSIREKLKSFLNAGTIQLLNIQSMDYIVRFENLREKEEKTIVTEPYYLFFQTGILAVSNYESTNIPRFAIRDLTRENSLSGATVRGSNLIPSNAVYTPKHGFDAPKDFFYAWGDRAYINVQAENPNPAVQMNQNLYVILTGFKFNINGLQ